MHYDVVIIEAATDKVDTIAGKNLPLYGSFHTVSKRIETVAGRINDRFYVASVPADRYAVGDKVATFDLNLHEKEM